VRAAVVTDTHPWTDFHPLLLRYVTQQNLGAVDPSRLPGGTNTPSPAVTPFRVQRADPYSGSSRNMGSLYSANEAGSNSLAGDAYGPLGERGAAMAWTDRSFREQQR
jgi:hypothetical protein